MLSRQAEDSSHGTQMKFGSTPLCACVVAFDELTEEARGLSTRIGLQISRYVYQGPVGGGKAAAGPGQARPGTRQMTVFSFRSCLLPFLSPLAPGASARPPPSGPPPSSPFPSLPSIPPCFRPLLLHPHPPPLPVRISWPWWRADTAASGAAQVSLGLEARAGGLWLYIDRCVDTPRHATPVRLGCERIPGGYRAPPLP